MYYRIVKIKLVIFNVKIKFLNSLAHFIDQSRAHFRSGKYEWVKTFLDSLSRVVHKFFDNIVQNKKNWKERIAASEGFSIIDE
jgi:cbb3-type cytochrome oxidase subunit 1